MYAIYDYGTGQVMVTPQKGTPCLPPLKFYILFAMCFLNLNSTTGFLKNYLFILFSFASAYLVLGTAALFSGALQFIRLILKCTSMSFW